MCFLSTELSFSHSYRSRHNLVKVGDQISRNIGDLGASVASGASSIATTIKTDKGIIRFVRANWGRLLSYTVAWGIIFAGVGLMYGFKATAIPLSIGMGCGSAFGVLLGILSVTVFDSLAKEKGNNTLWCLINKGFNSLDSNGTRAILVSVCVTVVMAASVVFPYVLGIIFGIIVGNHLATKISYNVKVSLGHKVEGHLDLGMNLKDPQVQATQLKELSTRIAELERHIKATS